MKHIYLALSLSNVFWAYYEVDGLGLSDPKPDPFLLMQIFN